LDHKRIHVVTGQRNTGKESVKDSADITGNAGDRERVEVVRRRLKAALQELDQIEFELQGGCTW